ncbi:unnamed protein product, partial [Closterium sp. NIES-65]
MGYNISRAPSRLPSRTCRPTDAAPATAAVAAPAAGATTAGAADSNGRRRYSRGRSRRSRHQQQPPPPQPGPQPPQPLTAAAGVPRPCKRASTCPCRCASARPCRRASALPARLGPSLPVRLRLARYSSPATAALSRLMLPYLFPDLAAFPTVADLITHLRTSDTRYRAALPAEGAPPPPFCPLLPLLLPTTSLASSRLALRLPLAGDAAPARARGARALEGLAGVVEVAVEAAEGVGVAVGVVAGVGASVAAVEAEAAAAVAVGAEEVVVAAVAEVAVVEAELVGVALRSGAASVVVSASSSSALVRPRPPISFVSGTLRVSRAGVLVLVPTSCVPATALGELLRSGVAIFHLDYDAILSAMYVVSTSDEGDCYLCVPPDPGIEAAALGAGEAAALGANASAAPGAGESALSGTTSAQAVHTFTLDSGASRSFFRDRTTLTPLSRPVAWPPLAPYQVSTSPHSPRT